MNIENHRLLFRWLPIFKWSRYYFVFFRMKDELRLFYIVRNHYFRWVNVFFCSASSIFYLSDIFAHLNALISSFNWFYFTIFKADNTIDVLIKRNVEPIPSKEKLRSISKLQKFFRIIWRKHCPTMFQKKKN